MKDDDLNLCHFTYCAFLIKVLKFNFNPAFSGLDWKIVSSSLIITMVFDTRFPIFHICGGLPLMISSLMYRHTSTCLKSLTELGMRRYYISSHPMLFLSILIPFKSIYINRLGLFHFPSML